MSTKYKYHEPKGTDFISTAVVYWMENDDLPGCSRAQVENTGVIRKKEATGYADWLEKYLSGR